MVLARATSLRHLLYLSVSLLALAPSPAQASFCLIHEHNLVYACANSPFAFTGTVESVTGDTERAMYRVHIRVHRSLRGEVSEEIDVWMDNYCEDRDGAACIITSDSASVYAVGDDVAVFFSSIDDRSIQLCTYTRALEGNPQQADPCGAQAIAEERARLESQGLVEVENGYFVRTFSEDERRESTPRVTIPPARGGCASCAAYPAQGQPVFLLVGFLVAACERRRRT